VVHVSPGSAETLVRGDGKINHGLLAYSISYILCKELSKSVNGYENYSMPGQFRSLRHSVYRGGSVAEWLACWTQAQKGPRSIRSCDAVG